MCRRRLAVPSGSQHRVMMEMPWIIWLPACNSYVSVTAALRPKTAVTGAAAQRDNFTALGQCMHLFCRLANAEAQRLFLSAASYLSAHSVAFGVESVQSAAEVFTYGSPSLSLFYQLTFASVMHMDGNEGAL